MQELKKVHIYIVLPLIILTLIMIKTIITLKAQIEFNYTKVYAPIDGIVEIKNSNIFTKCYKCT